MIENIHEKEEKALKSENHCYNILSKKNRMIINIMWENVKNI